MGRPRQLALVTAAIAAGVTPSLGQGAEPGVGDPAAAAGVGPSPVVRLALAEGAQRVRVNGALVGRDGEALVGGAGRVRRALGPPDECRLLGPRDEPFASLSTWRTTGVSVTAEPLFGPAKCEGAPDDPVLSLRVSAAAARIVTEQGTIRGGSRLPARLRASAERVRAAGVRRVYTWPLTDPCDGKIRPRTTALLVRTARGQVTSATAYTGITDVITCAP